MGKKEKIISKKHLITTSVILFVIFATIFIAFFYFIDSNLGSGFNAKEIFSAFSISLAITLFLLWIRRMMNKNLYLGIAISIAGLIAFIYAFLLRFSGPNTTIFLIIFGVIFFSYIGYIYFRNRKKKSNIYEYDDRL